MSKLRRLCLFIVIGAPSIAHAQVGELQPFTQLMQNIMTFVQGAAGILALGGIIRAGVMYTQGDERATQALKNALIGTACIVGGAIIIQFIKSSLG